MRDLENIYLFFLTNNHTIKSHFFNCVITPLLHFIFKERLLSFWGSKIREEYNDLALQASRIFTPSPLRPKRKVTIISQELNMILYFMGHSVVTG